MDRYTKAVQLARQQRQGGAGASIRGRSLVPAEINYTHTRKAQHYPGWLKQNRVITGDAQNDYAKAYKVLRTQVSQRMRQNGWRTLAVTSPGPGEGKTLTALNLSINLAMEANQTVLLVDADLGNPRIHSYLGIDVELGLSDYLLDGVPLGDILVHPDIRRLVLLPGVKPLANSSELLSSPSMLQLVQELKNRYPSRLVIFDLPSLLSADDVLAFVPYIDASLLVLEEGKSSQDDIVRSAELLKSINHNLIGTVLNKSVGKTVGYGYY